MNTPDRPGAPLDLRALPAPAPQPKTGRVRCLRCKAFDSAGLCCSSHKAALCHACYRRTHFVDICFEGCADCAAEGLDPLTAVTR